MYEHFSILNQGQDTGKNLLIEWRLLNKLVSEI